jgi:hypothetical protein
MTNFKEELQKDINKIVGILKENEELEEILKRRLTKKEFKFYKLKIADQNDATMMAELNCDTERFEEIKKQTILKLNQEKIKKELVG